MQNSRRDNDEIQRAIARGNFCSALHRCFISNVDMANRGINCVIATPGSGKTFDHRNRGIGV
jgi:hypothetical protein